MEQFINPDKTYHTFKSDTNSVNMRRGDICFRASRNTFSANTYQTNIVVELWFYRYACSENYTSNRCNISMEECIIWFDFIKKLFPFEYSISIDSENNNMYYMNICIKKANKLQYLFLMTAIRSVYERTNAIVMRDVFNLIKYELVSTDNLMDVFKIIMSTMQFSSGQTLFYSDIIIPLRSVSSYVEKLEKCDFSEIQNIDYYFNSSHVKTCLVLKKFGSNNIFKPSSIGKYEDLFDKDKIIERYKKYYRPVIEYHKKNKTLPEDFYYV